MSLMKPYKGLSLANVDEKGNLRVNAGRHARNSIAVAYEMLGGTEALAEWATENKDDFYTKLFPKIVTKEQEIGVTEDVENLLDKLDSAPLEDLMALDGECNDITEHNNVIETISLEKAARAYAEYETYDDFDPDN